MNFTWFLFIVIFTFALLIFSTRNMLIGKNIIKHPLFDNDEKRKYIFKKGLIVFIITIISGGLLIFLYSLVLF